MFTKKSVIFCSRMNEIFGMEKNSFSSIAFVHDTTFNHKNINKTHLKREKFYSIVRVEKLKALDFLIIYQFQRNHLIIAFKIH